MFGEKKSGSDDMAGSFFRVGFGVRLNVVAFMVYLWNPEDKMPCWKLLDKQLQNERFLYERSFLFRMFSCEVFVFVGVLYGF